jgi:DNA-binding SARP family transcriptional activator
MQISHSPSTRSIRVAEPAAAGIQTYTLGRFALLIGGAPLPQGPKAPRRSFELLKALVALGGRCVCEWKLCDALWPDAEADAARQNLKATLHRLRRLVGRHAVLLHDGKLSLAAEHCRVDAWEFERRINETLELPLGARAGELADRVEAALQLYRGPFLDGEELGFALRVRERLRGKLLRAVLRATQALQSDGQAPRALALLQRTIDLEPLEESLYEQLMDSWLAIGRPVEALKVYASGTAQLRAGAGIGPSRALDALRERAQRDRDARPR